MELAKSGKKQSQGGNPSTNANADKKSESGGSVGLAALATQALALEKETEDAETSAFAGQFAALLLAMSKSSVKEQGSADTWVPTLSVLFSQACWRPLCLCYVVY